MSKELEDLASYIRDTTAKINILESEKLKAIERMQELQTPILDRCVDTLGFSTRISKSLKYSRVHYVRDLVVKTRGEILRMRNIGMGSLSEIESKLEKLGLGINMELSHKTERILTNHLRNGYGISLIVN